MNTALIGIHVGLIPGELSPPNNWIGMLLLSRCLSVALSRAGLLAAPLAATGELNDCILFAAVSDAEDAAAVLRSELEAVRLLQNSQIGIQKGGEWECVYPSGRVRLNWLLDGERQELASAQHSASTAEEREALGRLLLLIRQNIKNRGQPGDKPPAT
jgi:hypothetical protein